ncbi:APC family permease [Leifsonia kafniensis]|uniref:APC family permease n=1 Tax=Leifsonia kafniensis TaxID=475957 RepID=A0ABP7KMN4_9MICO
MSLDAPIRQDETTTIAPRTLTTWKIITLIVGAFTPLAVVAGTVPLAFAFGGPSTTLAFIIAGAVIALFCVGYVQMVRRITRPGAFYSYIARGLGRPAGVGGAMVAVVGYVFGFIGAIAIQAFLAHEIIKSLFGIDAPWQVLLVIIVFIVGFLAYRKINLSAYVVGVIVIGEVVLLVVLAIAIFARNGIAAFPVEVIQPSVFGIGTWSVALIFAFLCFQGYEAGALYAPEAKRPEKTVPRALYGALVLFVAVLVLSTWTLTSVSGVEGQMEVILENGLGAWVLAVVADYLGPVGLWLFSLFTLFAQMAVAISITNFMSRYYNSLAREELLPRYLGRLNRYGAPYSAVFTLLGLGLVVPLVSAMVGIDPYTQLSSVAFGVGAIAATTLQAMASWAVVGFFMRRPASERHWWKTFMAPALAGVLLVLATVIEIFGIQWITGVEASWTMILPVLVLAALVLGIAFGFWLKKNKPRTYLDLAAGDSPEEAAALRSARIQSRSDDDVDRSAATDRDFDPVP